jgi:hypothetical protein
METGQHLHRRRLSAAVRADEAEDLTAFNLETDMIDCGEVAETTGQVSRCYDRLGIDDASRRRSLARADTTNKALPRFDQPQLVGLATSACCAYLGILPSGDHSTWFDCSWRLRRHAEFDTRFREVRSLTFS